MSELAFNYKGQRFAPPSRAVYWSVRRLRDGQRGQLDVVRDAHGLPLIVPIAIGIADFREAVGDQHGRYRLDALDADKMQIDGTEPAYVSVPQPRKVIEIEAGESADADLEHDLAVARDAVPVAGLRNAAMPTMVAPPSVAAPMVSSPIGMWPALPMPVAMSGEQYLVGEALRGLVQINMQQGNAHTAHLGQMTDMVASTLGAMQPLLLATNSRAERVESLLVELLLRQQGITPPSPPPSLVPPPAPPQPTPPPTPTVVYAMPRNAAFVDDDYDADEGYDADDDDLDDAPIAAKGEEDMIDKINRLVEKVATALAPVASVAQMVMGAGLGRGVFGGSDESPRNAAGDAPAGEPEAEADAAAEPSLAHLRTSHVLAVSHELGPQDGSIFRTMIRAMEPADRRMFVDRLCAMPIDEAVSFAAEKVDWLKARIARSRARCADATTDETNADDVSDVDASNPHQEHHTAQHDDAADLDEPALSDDPNPDQEQDTAHHDDDRDEPTHLDDQEHERDPHPDNLADTIIPNGDESHDDATDAPEASAPTNPTHNPMSTTATATEAQRPVTPDVTAHMKRIAKHLKFTEILQAQQLINSTSIAERNAWIERLMALDPIEAVAIVRAELARRASR